MKTGRRAHFDSVVKNHRWVELNNPKALPPGLYCAKCGLSFHDKDPTGSCIE